MNLTKAIKAKSSTNYNIIIPISTAFALIAILIACGIFILISLTKQLHTIAYLLICNTCASSIFYCVIQSNNYLFLLFISWETSDISCRLRGYFGYMSIVAVVYSYLVQAVSRSFISVFYIKYRWMISFKTHQILILIQWITVAIIPLPAILTHDIHYHPSSLCWVPKEKILHVAYTLFVYYLIPTTLIVTIYIIIYFRVKHCNSTALGTILKTKQNRDLEVLRNILILFGIYISGGVPTIIYILTDIKLFYSVGIVFISLTVAVEKTATIVLDRKIRKIVKKLFSRSTIIKPIAINNSIAVTKT